LSAPFEKARRTGKIRYNPIAGTSPEKGETLHKETFRPEQIAALLKVADPEWRGAILFAYNTGARLEDVATLKWSNLDVANSIVVFKEQKTAQRAVIGLHPDFLAWLAARETPEDPQAYVFPTLATKPIKGKHGLSNLFVQPLMRQASKSAVCGQGTMARGEVCEPSPSIPSVTRQLQASLIRQP
jgi:integrase